MVTHLFGHGLRPQMHDSFVEWLKDTPFVVEQDDAPAIAAVAQAVLGLIGEQRPGFVPTAWVPDDAHELWDIVDDLAVNADLAGDNDGAAAAEAMSLAAFALLMYLGDTGQWTGPEDDLRHCLNDLDPEQNPDTPKPLTPDTVTPARVDPELERQTLVALPLIQALTKLLDWFGAGKPVTGTGVLKPARATALAELLAIELPPRKIRSMMDVPELMHLWAVAQGLGMVAVTSTKAYPGAQVLTCRKGDLDLRRRAVCEFVARQFADDDMTSSNQLGAAVISIQFLLAGMTQNPLPTPDGIPVAEEPDVAVMAMMLQQSLGSLADAGLIVIDDVVTVPAPLQRAVHAGLPTYDFGDDDLEFDHGPDYELDVPELPKELGPAQEVTLKIELIGCEPAVWRQVAISPYDSLAQLHQIIQRVFGWEDSHLHEFVDGPVYSGAPVYLPAEILATRNARGQAYAEEATSVGHLLSGPGRTLTYLYDFGDDWIHEITVEAVGELSQAVPRCVAGNGMGPFEDCGGPHGWSMLVEAVNNPADPQHEEMRHWSGIAKNQRLDPSSFDVGIADAGLAHMRSGGGRV